jgi:hypothetical protein
MLTKANLGSYRQKQLLSTKQGGADSLHYSEALQLRVRADSQEAGSSPEAA